MPTIYSTWCTTYTVKPDNADTSIKQSSVLKGYPFLVIENFIRIKPLLRGCLSYKAILSLSQRCPLNTGLTLHVNAFLSTYIL